MLEGIAHITSAVVKFTFNDPDLLSNTLYFDSGRSPSAAFVVPKVRTVLEPLRIGVGDLPAFFRTQFGFQMVSGMNANGFENGYIARFVFASQVLHNHGTKTRLEQEMAYRWLAEGRTWQIHAHTDESRLWVKGKNPEVVSPRVRA